MKGLIVGGLLIWAQSISAQGALFDIDGFNDREEIAITRNTSESNNIIAQGLSLKPDDEILLWDQNHPSNDVSWAVRADRSKCKVNYFDIPLSTDNYDNIINIIENQITKKTRVVSFTHISNITGFKLPAAEICQSIKEKYNGIHIHVDGAQTWGVEDVDLAAMKCHGGILILYWRKKCPLQP